MPLAVVDPEPVPGSAPLATFQALVATVEKNVIGEDRVLS
jgi:hypothetical protein